MTNWKKKQIKEIYYVSDLEAQDSKFERQVSIIDNPTVEQTWFYHIKQKDTDLLQQMLDEKVVDINIKSQDGDSIVHLAITKRSKKLLDFCIKNKADFYKLSTYDEESGFYETVYGHVNLSIFKKVWSLIDKDKIMNVFHKPNCTGQTFIQKLVSDDRNIDKVIWIEQTFPNEWNAVKENKKLWEELEDTAKEENAQGLLLYLKGLQKIKNQLEISLPIKNQKKRRLKI
jgi:hypothetical protein